VVNATPWPFDAREWPGTHCTGGWAWTPELVWTGVENLALTGI